MSVETYATVARADDIARHWPDGREMPALIRDVTDYIKVQPWQAVGTTRLLGDRMDDYWIENGADLWRDFGIFMRLPDGSRVAQWFRAGHDGEPPVVLIGSEGETEILAPDLSSFLAAWALYEFDDKGRLVVKSPAGAVEVNLPPDLIRSEDEDDDEIPNGRPEFVRFLETLVGSPLVRFAQAAPPNEPFQKFFETWGQAARADIAADPHLRAIAGILDRFMPRGSEPWQRVSFHIGAVDRRVEIGGAGDPRTVLDPTLADAVRPHILAAREARAQGLHSPRGLWHSADLLLYPDGACHIAADWSAAPKFWHGPEATAAEFAADLARYPRSARWMEPWMAAG